MQHSPRGSQKHTHSRNNAEPVTNPHNLFIIVTAITMQKEAH